jgi:carbon monoxide dehydrogenase subunit G
MTGEQRIAAPQQRVWNALNDPEVLKACIPGCETVDKASDTEFSIVMLAAVGPVKAKFKGRLVIGEVDPPKHYVLSFEGSGGAAGFGKGSASVSLAQESDYTRLSYVAKAQVGGKLAQVGSRLIDGVARKIAEEFFGRFNSRFEAEAAAESRAASANTPDVAGQGGTATAQLAARAFPLRWQWALVAIVAALATSIYIVHIATR